MSLYGLSRVFAGYTSDNGTQYQVAITLDDSTAGGFSIVPYGSLPSLPRGWKMRKVYGVSSTGIRTKVPVATPTTALYTAGGAFTKGPGSVSFNTEGIIGEKRTAKS